ncbi:MAG: PadR family transcriptional regulator [Candidatus Aminicenantes bacterium]|nr:PadR family transcriptional regulator [Candidatus Aminicenantes bacterium]
MNLLSRYEEIILLTILKLGDEAYGVSIREKIFQDSGNLWSFASIYTPLEKLKRKGFVVKKAGSPSNERGGKSKYFYTVTEEGKQALLEIRTAQDKFWKGVPDF